MDSFSNFPVKGKVVLITGGGGGIGQSLVQACQAAGAKGIIVGDLRIQDGHEQTFKVPGTVFQKTDVAKWNELQALIDSSVREFGDVPDVYCPVAGIFETSWSNFWQDPEDEKYAMVDINVNHPIKLTRLAIRSLLGKNKQGVVCITASIAGYAGQYAAPLYCATKHAIVGFTRSMADTARLQGVKIATICPGVVKTPLWDHDLTAKSQFSIEDATALTPEAVAGAMMKLIQDSAFKCGTVYEISSVGERVVPAWNIDPPGMVAGKMAEGTNIPAAAQDKANEPIMAITAKERGALL